MASRSRYLARDPHWITARRREFCAAWEADKRLGAANPRAGCAGLVEPGVRVFYYPSTRSAYCAGCSPAVAARAEVELVDDDTFGTWS